jgi:hypothetical protein
VPKTYIWQDFRRFGATATAAVITAQLQRAGAVATKELPENRAKRLERVLAANERRLRLHREEKGVRAATSAYERLAAALKQSAENGALKPFVLVVRSSARNLALVAPNTGFMIEWHIRFVNSLEEAELVAGLWDSHPPWPGANLFDGPRSVGRKVYVPDFDADDDAIQARSLSARR